MKDRIKFIAMMICIIAVVGIIFAVPARAQCPCTAQKTDDIFSPVADTADATANPIEEPPAPPVEFDIDELARNDASPGEVHVVNSGYNLTREALSGHNPEAIYEDGSVDLALDYQIAIEKQRQARQRILDDPRFKPLIASLRENTPEYDKCVSLCQYLFTTIEKIEKAGNDDQSEFIVMAKWSLGDVMRDLRELGLDPTGLKDMVEAAGGDFERAEGAQPPNFTGNSDCPTCPKREELDKKHKPEKTTEANSTTTNEELLEQELRAKLNETPSPLDWGQGGIFEGRNPEDEVISKRDKTAKHFRNADGQIEAMITAGMPLNYIEGGLWKTIRKEIEPNETGRNTEYKYANVTNSIKTFYSNSIQKGIIIDYEGDEIKQFINPSIGWIVDGNFTKEISTSSVEGIVTAGKILFQNCFPSMDFRLSQENDGVKQDLILNSPTFIESAPEGATHFGFKETVILPEGWSHKYIEEDFPLIQLFNAKGEYVFSLNTPVFYDAALQGENGEMIMGKFLVEKSGNQLTIISLAPIEWLSSEKRVYPITLDPTSTIYASYGGWQRGTSSTGYVDNVSYIYTGYNASNSYYRAWAKFNTSTVTDASTVSSVTMLLYCNGVGSTSYTATIYVYDIATYYGNYGAYNSLYWTDLGDGTNYATYSVRTTGSYGPTSLGSSAATRLQGQLTNDRFQVGLTNTTANTSYWKRFTGSSYIVVTYATCTTPDNPSSPTISAYGCGSTTLTRGAPTSPIVWYWQGTTCGTSTANGNLTYSATSNGSTYYLRAYNSGCWSTGCSSITPTVYRNPTSVTAYVNGTTSLTICAEDQVNLTGSVSGQVCSGSYSMQYQWYHSGTAWTSSWSSSSSSSHRPTHSGYYYLRARCSVCGTGTYIEATGRYVTVTNPSYTGSPSTVTASPSATICQGTALTLTVPNNGCGGRYYWTKATSYSACSSTRATCSATTYNQYSNYGSNTIVIDPAALTPGTHRFQVERRANVNGTSMGTTGWGCIAITVKAPPSAPTGLSASATTVCYGNGVTLTASGGSNGDGATFTWRTGSCTGTVISSGSTSTTLTVNPTTTTTYFVQRVGNSPCNGTLTTCASRTVNVYNNGYSEGVWRGNVSNAWGNCQNWGKGREPVSSTNVSISTGVTNWPYITATGEVANNIDITAGAKLFINSGSLTFGSSGYIYNRAGSELTIANGTVSGYRIENYGGTININGGTTTLSSYIYNRSGYESTNIINMTGGTLNTVSIPNYSGQFNHSGGTINNSGYYQDNGTAGGRYYGSGTATMNFTGTSSNYIYIRATTTPLTYFNNVNISDTRYINGSSTQPFDVNGTFTINSGAEFQATGKPMNMAGNWVNNGTFTHGNNTVTLDGGSATITTGGSGTGKKFYDLSITGGTKTLSGALGVDRNITITGTMAQGDNAAYIGGSWNSSSGTVSVNNGTRTYFNGSTTPVTIAASNSSNHFGYLTPNKSVSTNVINMANSFKAYRCEPNRGVFNMNGYTLSCDTYMLVNYDNNDSPLDATLNVGSGRVNAPSGFQTKRGGKTTLTSGIIDVGGYFIVYTGTNPGIFDMDGGTLYNSGYLTVENGAYFYGDGGTVEMDGTSQTYITNYNTTNSYFNNLKINKTSTGYIYLNGGNIKVNGDLDVSTTGAGGTSGGIEPRTWEILTP